MAMEETILPIDGPAALLEYLEEIVGGSHPSLGDTGRQQLRNLFRHSHVFAAPGEQPAVVSVMCTHLRSYLRGAQFTCLHAGICC